MPGADCCDTIEHAEALRAEQVGGAIAVDADQVGHHVGGAILAAIDSSRTSEVRVSGGGSCATTTSGG